MKKIFIDTNIFLDFYRISKDNDPLKVLINLENHCKHLIFPVQVYNEFLRNRINILNDALKILKDSLKLPNIQASSLFISTDEFQDLGKAKKSYSNALGKFVEKVEDFKNNNYNDPVYMSVSRIFNSDQVTKASVSDSIIDNAKKRQLLGNPPRNVKKMDTLSAGDEIIWESILEIAKYDIVIVSRDCTYMDNYIFLNKEFQEKTGYKIISIKNRINDALKEIGEQLPSDAKKAEEKLITDIEEQIENYGIPATPVSSSIPNSSVLYPNLYNAIFNNSHTYNYKLCSSCGSLYSPLPPENDDGKCHRCKSIGK